MPVAPVSNVNAQGTWEGNGYENGRQGEGKDGEKENMQQEIEHNRDNALQNMISRLLGMEASAQEHSLTLQYGAASLKFGWCA